MCFNDIEFIVLILFAVFLFALGLRKRENQLVGKYTGIDLPMSSALKGIACVFILMGHFVSRRTNIVDATLFSKLIYLTTANIALAIFMYFSGYGLSLKYTCGRDIFPIWYKRIRKVYIPLFLTCVVTLIVYAFLPDRFTSAELEDLNLSKDIWYLHHFDKECLRTLIPHLFGWKDWYVFCIIIFYSFFYLSIFITRNKSHDQTLVLWLFLIAYYFFAYFYFGPAEAHWYRYCWAFFFGHIHAKLVQNRTISKWNLIMLALLLSTMLFETPFMILSYIIAITIIIVCSRINKKHVIKSKVLAFMGVISYFFYLSHGRISVYFMSYSGCYSVIVWVIATTIVSYMLLKIYFFFENKMFPK